MRALRIFLQVVIVAFGASGVAVLFGARERDYLGIAGFLLAVAALLALTLMLKEQTESRKIFGREVNPWPLGVFLLLLGVFGLYLGGSYLFGADPLPEGGRCRLLCSIVRVTAIHYGELAGRAVGFALWSAVGAFLAFIGYRLARQGRPA